MNPVLYRANETQFRNFGLGEIADAYQVLVTRERNGNYTLYIKYPIDGVFASVFKEEMQIKSDAGRRTKWQTFEINRVLKNSDGYIEVFARHISMRTQDMTLRPKTVGSSVSAQVALNIWKDALIGDDTFEVASDIQTVGSFDWEVENARDALGGTENSILDIYGGEYEFDNRTIILHKKMGRKAPTFLEYGRNIISVEEERLLDGNYTSIYPYVRYTSKEENSKEQLLTLPEIYLDGSYISLYSKRRIKIVDFSGSFEQEEVPTLEKLRRLAQKYLKNNDVGSPKISTRVDYIDLSQTLDYDDFKIMEEVELCDIVPLYYPKFGITTQNEKVVEIVYNVYTESNQTIKLGTIGQSMRNALTSNLSSKIDDVKRKQTALEISLPKYLADLSGNKVWYEEPDENVEHKIGDYWFEENGKYTRIKMWDGNQWITMLDTEELPFGEKEYEALKKEIADKDTALKETIQRLETKSNQSKQAQDERIQDILRTANVSQNLAEEAKRLSVLNSGVINVTKDLVDSHTRTISDQKNSISQIVQTSESLVERIERLNVGSRNYLLNSKKIIVDMSSNDGVGFLDKPINISEEFWSNADVYSRNKIKISLYFKTSKPYSTPRKFPVHFRKSPWYKIGDIEYPADTTDLIKYTFNFDGFPRGFKASSIFIRFTEIYDRNRIHTIEKAMLEIGDAFSDWKPAQEEQVDNLQFNEVKNTVDSHVQTIFEQGQSISQVIQTSKGIVSRVSKLEDNQLHNLVYDPTNYSLYQKRSAGSNLTLVNASNFKLIRISEKNLKNRSWRGFKMPLSKKTFKLNETYSYRVSLWVDELPDGRVGFEIKNRDVIAGSFTITPDKIGANQVFTGTFRIGRTVLSTDDFGLHVWLDRNGTVGIGQLSIVEGDTPPEEFIDSTSPLEIATQTQVSQLAGSWSIQNLNSAGDLVSGLNLGADGVNRLDGRLTHITGQTLIDNAVIKDAMIANLHGGKITAGSIGAEQIKAGAITADKLLVNDALFDRLTAGNALIAKLMAKEAFIKRLNAITIDASKITSGVLMSKNGAMSMNLNTANIDFNQNASINFNSANNVLVRKKGTHTAFIHFQDTHDKNGSIYLGLGVTSSGDGVNSRSSGRFSGIRVFRSASGYSHIADNDKIEIYGDTVYLRNGFDNTGGYVFKTIGLNGAIDVLNMYKAIERLNACFMHLKNTGFNTSNANFQSAISSEISRIENFLRQT